MSVEIYHNPHCSKSRQTLELLQTQGVEPKVVEYLKTPPDKARLKQLLKMMKMTPRELLRKREKDTIKATGVDDESLGHGDPPRCRW